MPWSTTRKAGTAAKYRSSQHRQLRAYYAAQLRAGIVLTCTAPICVMPSRAMTNPNGRDPDGLHLGHNDDGVTYAGPQHCLCNVRDGAKRGNQASRRRNPNRSRRWTL